MKRKNKILMRIAIVFFMIFIAVFIYTNLKYMFKLSGWEILIYHTYDAVILPGIPLGIGLLISFIVWLDEDYWR